MRGNDENSRKAKQPVTDTIDIMKKLLLSAILLCGIVMFTMAGPVQTTIIPANGPALTVAVQSDQVLRILNFVHEVGGSPGTAFLTLGSQSTAVMQSIARSTQEAHIVLNLAGPATLTVAGSGGTLIISYKVDSNSTPIPRRERDDN